MNTHDEAQAVAARYARRAAQQAKLQADPQGAGPTGQAADRYSALRPEVWQTLHERQRVLLGLFAAQGITDLSPLRLTEVGCGSGGNLLELLRLGFAPARLQGVELLPERHAQARQVLPAATQVWLGNAADAAQAPIEAASQDLVLQSTVFSSLLNDAFQQQLAAAMWRWLRPGGAVLWYDFSVNNPRNPDVRGVPMARVCSLFPASRIIARRVTLAPPLARILCRLHPALYTVFNLLPLLRTHRLAWIQKLS